ncbi:hypothetical protein A3SI_16847 [Nitritalea halalkaliphila LW7]|uniref:DUF805 domain-containing protein n=1 Tax=Nitritalea halalkaliphila LW7 TaxID=1189621 RepID=I5BWF9_9BACT|nr:DUF805 domain-containing protein [Nitritalea halalkaliphila]EIM73911.1 hypothetical protein A3SI_16847 [Nitritalea halalkaliphila LW7]
MIAVLNPNGRITRRKYLTLFLIFYSTNVISLIQLFYAYKLQDWIAFAIFGTILISTIVMLLVQAIRRLHDIGLDYKYVIYLIIPPPLNFIGFIWLALKPGQDGENAYGPDPRKTDIL